MDRAMYSSTEIDRMQQNEKKAYLDKLAAEGLYALCAAKVERDALRKEAKASNEKIVHLDRTVSEMMTEKGQLLTENEKLKQKVELYESLLSEEALVNMIVKDLDREGLIRLLMLKQGVKE